MVQNLHRNPGDEQVSLASATFIPVLRLRMLYQAYQFYTDAMVPARNFAQLGLSTISPFKLDGNGKWLGNFTAACELISRAKLTHSRPPFGIKPVRIGNRDVPVTEEAIDVTPFGTLLHFKKDVDQEQP